VIGNQGTTYLEEVGLIYKVIVEASIDEGEAPSSSKIRQLEVGEIVEVQEWGKKERARFKGKAKADDVLGWVSVADSGGNASDAQCATAV